MINNIITLNIITCINSLSKYNNNYNNLLNPIVFKQTTRSKT